MAKIRQLLQAALDVVMPRTCPVCGKALTASEQWLCIGCLSDLPRTDLHSIDGNEMEQLFYGKTPAPIEHASGFIWYEKGSNYSNIIHDIKYRHMPQMGQWLAAMAAKEMPELMSGIDAVVPVPLHATKLAKRGYNQSDFIAQGVAQVSGATVVHALKAIRSHSTQTHKSALERWENIKGAYALVPGMERELEGKHILIVDDVATTGSTLEACVAQIQAVPQVKVSLFTLAVARLS
ncbi:MAG: ComF family protein [Muribaculaceae bacterium]|nr:ComF family protein [Muribaculaceae bacterium]